MDDNSGQSSLSAAAAVLASQNTSQSIRRSAILKDALFWRIFDSPQSTLSAQSHTISSGVPVPGRTYMDLGDCTNVCEYYGALLVHLVLPITVLGQLVQPLPTSIPLLTTNYLRILQLIDKRGKKKNYGWYWAFANWVIILRFIKIKEYPNLIWFS